MGKKGSLARQLLVLQLLIVLILLGAVAAVAIAQAREDFRATEGRRMLGVAENLAANPGLWAALHAPSRHQTLAPFAESARAPSGAEFVAIARPDLQVLASQDPDHLRNRLPLGESTVTQGGSWVGVIGDQVVAHVPVIGDGEQDYELLGYVAAGQQRPSIWQLVADNPANLIALLGMATALGVAGSLWLAWWVKRQTLGLEPSEITGLVEHREAMLHGIKEGVIGLDQQQRVTLVNDKAKELLSLPDDVVGRSVRELDLNDRVVDVLTGTATGSDQIVLRRGKVLIMNRMPIRLNEQVPGSVVTLRDRTELVELRDQLDANRNTTETLRAQAHEFSNRLHTIAGLIELGEYDEVSNYVDRVSASRDQWQAEVIGKVDDSAVAALLIAKASLAAEQGVGLRLSASSELRAIDDALSADLVTVLGNLVDNALDALRGQADGDCPGWIEVDLQQSAGEVRVQVTDSGPGIAPEIAEEVFRHGFTTKAAEQGGQRGLGLALTRQICVRRGGMVEVHNAEGAVFTATMANEVRT
ncbi:MAG: GHKL domain-containing protein [Actinophytocola sp.]|nr:GHKL domain-containing protein [Actinophytocola sp.]